MNRKQTTGIKITLFFLILTGFENSSFAKEPVSNLPNILWLTSEDNSTFLGCYGDKFATTPNLDKLATQGFLYTHCYANAPVCAPARNTIITGIYAPSGGNENMRSTYPKSEIVKTYPEFLREIGYYCTNNSKTDYNTEGINPEKIWAESSAKAHYKNRKPGQPFFAVFNSTISHESCLHKSVPTNLLRHNPEKVPLPPYHPATPEMKHDWAQYYDKVEEMDKWIGEMMKELDKAGLTENTIVFYYADNGGVLGRSKRYVYESGTHVPFIVRIPEKYKHLFPASKPGEKIDRLISFVDLFPTLLSITGIPVPSHLQGNAFLGSQKTKDPEYAYMFRNRMDERYDMCRAIRDKKFRYIRNFTPYRVYGQPLEYLWRAPSMPSWENAYKNGQCNETQSIFWNTKPAEELYDTENDPWEVKNLATNPEYKDVLTRMRSAIHSFYLRIADSGFIPEAELTERRQNVPAYDFMRTGNINYPEIVEAANLATLGNPVNLKKLKKFLKSKDSTIRYWGATGLLILGEKSKPAINDLKLVLNDKSISVVNVAAEALYNLGEKDIAVNSLIGALNSPNEFARVHALNVLDCINVQSPEIIQAISGMVKKSGKLTREQYDLRGAKRLFEKWGLTGSEYEIKL